MPAKGARCFQQFGPQLLSTNRSDSPISTGESAIGAGEGRLNACYPTWIARQSLPVGQRSDGSADSGPDRAWFGRNRPHRRDGNGAASGERRGCQYANYTVAFQSDDLNR